MNISRKVNKRLKKLALEPIWRNPFYLSAKSSYRLLFRRPENFYEFSRPLLVISGLQRSGTHLVENLLKNHPRILSYYRELQIGKPNKYYWPDLDGITDPKERFAALIPQNMIKHFLSLNAHENFFFDFSRFRNIFLSIEKKNAEFDQRQTLNNFFTAYFNAYLNCNHSNFHDEYQYIVTTIPGLSIREDSISSFYRDYPDGKIIVSLRDPYLWWNSARKHTKKLKTHGLERYANTLKNVKWASGEYKGRFFAVSFDHLIKDTQSSIRSILRHTGLAIAETSMYPSNFPDYATDNSTFGHKKTKSVLKDKIKRELDIPDEDAAHIKSNIYPLYRQVLENHTINLAEDKRHDDALQPLHAT